MVDVDVMALVIKKLTYDVDPWAAEPAGDCEPEPWECEPPPELV